MKREEEMKCLHHSAYLPTVRANNANIQKAVNFEGFLRLVDGTWATGDVLRDLFTLHREEVGTYGGNWYEEEFCGETVSFEMGNQIINEVYVLDFSLDGTDHC